MARCSTVIPDRVRCVPLAVGADGVRVHGVTIDRVLVGAVQGWRGGPWVWTEQPDKACSRRTEAVDTLVRFKLKQWKEGVETPPEPIIADASIPRDIRRKVEARDKGLCQYCLMAGRIEPGVVCDHFKPIARGGESTFDNLQLSCRKCNNAKRHWHPENYFGPEWEQRRPGNRRRWDRLTAQEP